MLRAADPQVVRLQEICANRTWLLPADEEERPGSVDRFLLLAQVETPNGSLPFLTTHLTWYAGHLTERRDQEARDLPPIVPWAGPARRVSLVLGALRRRDLAPRQPVRRRNGRGCSPARLGVLRTGLQRRGGRVIGARTSGDAPGSYGVWASDHAGVVVDLTVPATD